MPVPADSIGYYFLFWFAIFHGTGKLLNNLWASWHVGFVIFYWLRVSFLRVWLSSEEKVRVTTILLRKELSFAIKYLERFEIFYKLYNFFNCWVHHDKFRSNVSQVMSREFRIFYLSFARTNVMLESPFCQTVKKMLCKRDFQCVS